MRDVLWTRFRPRSLAKVDAPSPTRTLKKKEVQNNFFKLTEDILDYSGGVLPSSLGSF